MTSSKNYPYSSTLSYTSSSYTNDYDYNDYSKSYSLSSSDYTQGFSSSQSQQYYTTTGSTSSSYPQTDSNYSTVNNSSSSNINTQDNSTYCSQYQLDSYNSNSNSNSNNSISNSDNCIYYNLSSSNNSLSNETDNSNLSSVMTESLFLNSDGDVCINMDNSDSYFSHFIKPIRILDSKCSSRNGRRPSKFEPFSLDSSIPESERSKYCQIERFFTTELQEWLSNSRIGMDLTSDIFNYIILNESFDSTYQKLKKWIVSLYWSAYDAQEIDNRVKEMKLLEEEINTLKS